MEIAVSSHADRNAGNGRERDSDWSRGRSRIYTVLTLVVVVGLAAAKWYMESDDADTIGGANGSADVSSTDSNRDAERSSVSKSSSTPRDESLSNGAASLPEGVLVDASSGEKKPGQPTKPPQGAVDPEKKPAGDKDVEKPNEPKGSAQSADDFRELGKLKTVEKNTYESTAGLRYGPGSREGHRLSHLFRHAEDDPDRPGSHGVFEGGREKTLEVLDEAWLKAEKGGKDVQSKKEEGRVVYTINMQRRIGYVGGQSGKRSGKPAATHVRMVLEGKNVITAYPLRR